MQPSEAIELVASLLEELDILISDVSDETTAFRALSHSVSPCPRESLTKELNQILGNFQLSTKSWRCFAAPGACTCRAKHFALGRWGLQTCRVQRSCTLRAKHLRTAGAFGSSDGTSGAEGEALRLRRRGLGVQNEGFWVPNEGFLAKNEGFWVPDALSG